MTDEISFDGIRYISAGEAGELAGFSRDYIARLCKEDKLVSKRIGKQWYVSEGSVKDFAVSQEYARAKRREQLTKERRMEYKGNGDVAPRKIVFPNAFEGVQSVRRNATPIAVRSHIHNALAAAAARMPDATRTARMVTSVPVYAASVGKHAGAHIFPPVTDALHKLFAIVTALTFVVGTYLFVDAQYARIAQRSTTIGSEIVEATRAQLAAAQNPMEAVSNVFSLLAQTFNRRVDSLVYGIMFPFGASPSQTGVVSVRVVPQERTTTVPAPSTSPSIAAAPSTSAERVVERVREIQRIVSSAGGITEEYLNTRLTQLNNDLSSQLYAVAAQSSRNTTEIVNNYNAVGGAQRIDQLDKIDLNNSTISGGSITGASASLTSLAVTGTGTTTFAGGVQATALNITSTSASSTFANGINLADGCFAVDGTCITGSGGGGSGTPGGSDTQVQFNDNGSFAGSSTFTFSSSTGLLKVANASTTLLSIFDRLYVGGSATTTIRGDGVASTFPYASSTALSVSGTGYFTTASTTNLIVSSAGGSTGCATFAADGTISNTGTACGSGSGGFAWTPDTYNGVVVNATSTALWLKGTSPFSLIASSTFMTQASTTLFTNSGLSYLSGLVSYASSTIGAGGQATGLTISGGATTTLNAYFGSNVGVGTTTPTSLFSVHGTSFIGNGTTATSTFNSNLDILGSLKVGTGSLFLNSTSLQNLSGSLILQPNTGNVGVGTTSPYAKLSVSANIGETNRYLFAIASTTNSATTTTFLTVNNTGLFSIGGDSNLFSVDAVTGTTTIANLNIGNIRFETNAGVVSLSDIPVDSNAAQGVAQAQSIDIGGLSLITAYGQSNGSGGVQNLGVGIGTSTSPYSMLQVWGTPTTNNLLSLVTNASTTVFQVTNTGSTTIASILNVAGTATSTIGGGLSTPYLNITGTSASSTFASGINLAAGCFAVNGTCVGTGSGLSSAFPFTPTTFGSTAANSTSTLIGFTQGIYSLASSTIGDGTQTGGLTISGGATTTGNTYVTGSVAIGAQPTAGSVLTVNGNITTSPYLFMTDSITSPTNRGVMLGNTTGVVVGLSKIVGFDSSTTAGDTPDTALSRISTGVLALGNGTTGNYTGTLLAHTIGLGTSTPYAQLSIVATSTTGVGAPTTLFAIASTTGGTATTTLFSVSNTGIAAVNGSITLPTGAPDYTSGVLNFTNSTRPTGEVGIWANSVNNFGLNFGLTGSSLATKMHLQYDASGNHNLQFNNDIALTWNASSIGTGALDTSLSRLSAGTLGVGFGSTQGAFNGTLAAERIGLGTSTPYAQLSIIATSTNGLGAPTTLFAIASTTGGTATTSLFTISNTGIITSNALGTSTFSGGLSITGGGLGVLSLNASSCDLKADTSGNFFCGTDGTGSGSWPFTPSTYGGVDVQATSTGLWLTGSPLSLIASSTFFTQASTTLFTNSGLSYLNGGLVAYASSTIGAGGQTTGLTISGGATTTGNANFVGSVRIGNNASSVTITPEGGNILTLDQGAIQFAGNGTPHIRYGSSAGAPGYSFKNDDNTGIFGENAGDLIGFSTAGVERARFTTTGLGIGTTSPYAKLSIAGNVGDNNQYLFAISSSTSATTTSLVTLDQNGLFSVGSNYSNLFSVDAITGSTTISNLAIGNLNFDTNAGIVNLSDIPVDSGASAGTIESQSIAIAGNPVLTVYGLVGGNNGGIATTSVGIGTSSPSFLLDVASTTTVGPIARFTNVSGSCAINPTNTALECSSDLRLKKDFEGISATSSLAKVLALNPVFYNWLREATGTPKHTGFIAQEVQELFPDLVSQSGGYYTLNYAGFTPYLASAIQELNSSLDAIASSTEPAEGSFAESFFQNLFARIGTWFADAANDIGDFFANRVHTRELCVSDAGGAETCITKPELDALLAGQVAVASAPSTQDPTDSTQSSSTPSATNTTDTTAPVITLHGENPTYINIGESYVDAGVTVIDEIDGELTPNIFLDGEQVESVAIDTAVAGNHEIRYYAIDAAGNSAQETRTVIVVAGSGEVNLPAEEPTLAPESAPTPDSESSPQAEPAPSEPAPEVVSEPTPTSDPVPEPSV